MIAIFQNVIGGVVKPAIIKMETYVSKYIYILYLILYINTSTNKYRPQMYDLSYRRQQICKHCVGVLGTWAIVPKAHV